MKAIFKVLARDYQTFKNLHPRENRIVMLPFRLVYRERSHFVRALTDRRCWFKPPFASIMRKPFEGGNSVYKLDIKTTNFIIFPWPREHYLYWETFILEGIGSCAVFRVPTWLWQTLPKARFPFSSCFVVPCCCQLHVMQNIIKFWWRKLWSRKAEVAYNRLKG